MNKTYLFLAILLISSGCAKRYYDIHPQSFNYENRLSASGSLRINYVYDVQFGEHNKKYSQKERDSNLKLLALSIENTSIEPIQIKRGNLDIKTASGRKIPSVDMSFYSSKVRQKPENYVLFYGIAGLGVYSETDPYGGSTKVKVIYNPLPLIIGAGNAIFAGVANNKHKRNLKKYDIDQVVVPPKSTINGVIAVSEPGFPELIFEYSEN
ncbi:MAG: hypothetical protein ABJN36_16290 [Cyclobacteriaceae bacterium]